ncbi:MAG TPA: FAD-binding oxidoreductase [Acidimicrobiales bacterium]|nr:FAD-binding oxidoreductase [Acidimicrobiales bacterium]
MSDHDLEILRPNDAGYDEARRLHNGLIDKRPALIARCRTAADVAAAVARARKDSLEISVRGGGHNVAGKAVTEGGVMIDLSPMKQIVVDPGARTVRAQPGLTWGEFNIATATHGLATTGGIVSTTGISGLTLGGGYGWLQGKYGLSVDNLLAAEVVTADGHVLDASEHDNADLFWALRGGGGNFGVVTSFTYRLHPVTTVLGGSLAFPLTGADAVIDAYRRLTEEAPDELGVQCGLLSPDPSTKVAAIVVCHCGDLDQAEADIKSVRQLDTPLVDSIGPRSYVDQNRQIDESFPPGALNYWKSAFFTDLSDEAARVLIDQFEQCPSPMSFCVLESMGGAASRVASAATAYPHREPGHNLLLLSQWADPADTEPNIAWTRETFEALRPHMAKRRYVNYLSADDAGYTRDAYGSNYERLVELKRRYDPANIFHLNQNIDPSVLASEPSDAAPEQERP